ncbi:poly polymerase and DNA-ligase Zn-finger region-domain-containing protein [Trametes polyzona]|nr:poly polymerase and DNA-ligase Zn-finger region-domain-containing protein [Trametes polyzona]
MSDTEGTKKSGYRLEYASSGRSKCNGPKPCKGTAIGKGELRFGSVVDFRGNTSFSWRHWGCVTSKIISNMKNAFDEADELDGFEDLKEEDQERVKKAWEEGHVAPEDVPETARKADGEEGEDDEEEKPKKGRGKKKDEDDGGKGVFKFEYASSGRSKCKECGEQIGKDYFRFGQEVDFRGNKSFSWRHWGCSTSKLIEKLKASYDEPSQIPGWDELKEGEQEKVQRAWDGGEVPTDDKGAGEPVDTGKKKPVPRKKKDEDGEEKPKKARAPRKKVEDEDEEMDDEDEEPKPKKGRGAAKAAPAKAKAAPKKAAAKKKKDESESGEDFGDDIAAVDGEEVDEEDEEPEELTKKRKRAPASKNNSSKPPSKRAKPSSSAKPPSKAKPASSRGKKKVEEPIEESDEDNYD